MIRRILPLLLLLFSGCGEEKSEEFTKRVWSAHSISLQQAGYSIQDLIRLGLHYGSQELGDELVYLTENPGDFGPEFDAVFSGTPENLYPIFAHVLGLYGWTVLPPVEYDPGLSGWVQGSPVTLPLRLTPSAPRLHFENQPDSRVAWNSNHPDLWDYWWPGGSGSDYICTFPAVIDSVNPDLYLTVTERQTGDEKNGWVIWSYSVP